MYALVKKGILHHLQDPQHIGQRVVDQRGPEGSAQDDHQRRYIEEEADIPAQHDGAANEGEGADDSDDGCNIHNRFFSRIPEWCARFTGGSPAQTRAFQNTHFRMNSKGSNLCARVKSRAEKKGGCPILMESGQM